MKTAILIVGHGSREARANADFERFVAAFAERDHGSTVAHGYVELAKPSLDEALAALAPDHELVVVVPFFLFLVGHAKNDVPIALARARQAHPRTRFVATRELGVCQPLLELAFRRATAVAEPDRADTVAVLVGRGSSDPDANGEFWKLARLFGEGRGFRAVVPAFVGIAKPLVPEALDLVARLRPRALVVVPYLLFDGRLADKIRAEVAAFHQQHPWIRTTVAGVLGPDPTLPALVEERVASALAESPAPLPCDTCQYRAPVAGVAHSVGGLRALLYSIRHGLTHAQAAPHPHAHRPLAKHVLVCANADCADRGSLTLLERLRQLVRATNRQRDIRVTRTSCMGRCGEGPTVVVYPDGIWYRGVTPGDASALVREHLLGDRLVPHLIDNIMQ